MTTQTVVITVLNMNHKARRLLSFQFFSDLG